MQKAKREIYIYIFIYDNGGKENTTEYYQANKDVIKEKANSKYNNLTKEYKEAKKSITRIGMKKVKENAKKY